MRVRHSWYGNPLYVGAKRWLFEFLFRSGLLAVFRFLRRNSVLVAIYHDVLPAGYPEDNPLFGMTVRLEEFAWQVDYFKKHYNPITFRQFTDWYFHGQPLPKRPVLITFDDGHANNYRNALPVLKDKNVAAACFVVTGALGSSSATWFEDAYYRLMFSSAKQWRLRNGEVCSLDSHSQRVTACGRFFVLCRTLSESGQQEELQSLREQLPVLEVGSGVGERFLFLSQEEIRRLSECGIEIGSHTVSHPILGALETESARQEIAKSRSLLEEVTGKPVSAFAYPFGGIRLDFTARDEALVKECGYDMAFAGEGGFVTRASNQFALPRVGIGKMSRSQFATTAAGAVESLKNLLAFAR